MTDTSMMDTTEPGLPKYEATSANTSSRIQNNTEILPAYTEDLNPEINSFPHLQNALCNPHRDRAQDVKLWEEYLSDNSDPRKKKPNKEDDVILSEFISAIRNNQPDVIKLLIENDLVTANSTINPSIPATPLLSAISHGKTDIVRLLIDLGADRDRFGIVVFYGQGLELRTPLQLAAALGNLVLVKILKEEYQCDDSIVARDGQIALRLAAENGHWDVVKYLPARRGGGYLRWKHRNKDVLRRIKNAGSKIWTFVRALLWDVPKLIVWEVPRHLVVKPMMRGCVWCWRNKYYFGSWCRKQVVEMPRRIADFSKGCWKFGTKTMPRWILKGVIWCINVVTVRVPKSIAILSRWIWNGIASASKLVWRAILRVVSSLATAVEAMATFFWHLTLKDVWNGLWEVLRALFVAFPTLVGTWIAGFAEASYKMMKTWFGEVGEIAWYVVWGLGWIVLYLPVEVWKILKSLWASISKAGHEVKVWVNPKTR